MKKQCNTCKEEKDESLFYPKYRKCIECLLKEKKERYFKRKFADKKKDNHKKILAMKILFDSGFSYANLAKLFNTCHTTAKALVSYELELRSDKERHEDRNMRIRLLYHIGRVNPQELSTFYGLSLCHIYDIINKI